MNELLNSVLEQINNHHITLDRLILLQLVIGGMLLIHYIFGKRLLKYLYEKGTITETDKKKLRNIIRFAFFLLTLIFGVLILGINIGIPTASSTLNIANVLLALLIIQIARLFDYFFGSIRRRSLI